MLFRVMALRKASWSFPLLALAFLSAACSDDGGRGGGPTEPNVPTGVINITIDPAAVEFFQGGSGTSTITLTRVDFEGPIELSVEGLPNGVTASFSPSPVPADANTSTLTVSAAADVEPDFYEVTLRARSEKAVDRTSDFLLNIREAEDPYFEIMLDSDRLYTVQRGTAQIGFEIDRADNFEEPVYLHVEDLPAGMAFTVTNHEIQLWIGQHVQVGDYTLTIVGEGGDLTESTELLVRVFQYNPVVAGGSHSLAVAEDGSLWSWGRNDHGQLGQGDMADRAAPTQVGDNTDWLAVAAGKSHSLALKKDGTLWAAGSDEYGQLGMPDEENATFWRVGADEDWVAIAAGDDFSVAIRADRTLWAWGRNQFGQIGNGSTDDQHRPVRLAGEDWIQVAAGAGHVVAVKADGTLWSWGDNAFGQLGHGDVGTSVTQPKQVDATGRWLLAAAGLGGSATLAIKDDGTLWAWGRNLDGELGLGEDVEAAKPQKVGEAMDWVGIATGAGFSFALDADGDLWATGTNALGRLGIGEPGEHNRYEFVRTLGNWWEFVSAGAGHTLAIGPEGLLYAWGSNEFGQLGLGTAAGQGTGPVQSIRALWP